MRIGYADIALGLWQMTDLRHRYHESHSALFMREWRQHRALSQPELAALSGVDRVTVNLMENGKCPAMPATRRKFAKALGIEPHVFAALPPPVHGTE
jgi:DNA-binding XRE family transcriptional regulator